MQDKKIVLFDGVCNFCNYWVRFIFKYNSKQDIYFMPLQDERAIKLLPQHINPKLLESIVYYRAGETFTSSTAALKIAADLNLPFKIISKLGMLIPKRIRDAMYNFIGKRRYRLFGKKENCPIPSPKLRQQFL